MILRIANKILNTFGLKMRQRNKTSNAFQRTSMRGCLEQAVKNGLNPSTVIDVGVAQGTPELYEVFPRAKHILIEPLEEFLPYLKCVVSGLDNAEYVVAAAASKPGRTVINVHPDLVGSSVYKESENSNVNGIERTVSAVTLDGVCREKKTKGPYLIKIDTQGSELDVLKGAGGILHDTEFVMLEASLFRFFENGPLLQDCVAFMKDRGFYVYDIFGLSYRPLDNAMSQVNIAFVKEKSKYRQFHFYATKKQRDEQNKRLLKLLKDEKSG